MKFVDETEFTCFRDVKLKKKISLIFQFPVSFNSFISNKECNTGSKELVNYSLKRIWLSQSFHFVVIRMYVICDAFLSSRVVLLPSCSHAAY